MKHCVIEVEVDADRNRNLYFVPLERSVRGRFDWKRVADRHSAELRDKWGEEPIPGQRILVDVDKSAGSLVEPLHNYPEIKRRIEERGETLPPERQTFTNIDVNEWLYWLRLAVDSGKASLLNGELPQSVPHRPKRFGQSKSTTDRLSEALVAVLYAGLSEKQRKEVAELVAV